MSDDRKRPGRVRKFGSIWSWSCDHCGGTPIGFQRTYRQALDELCAHLKRGVHTPMAPPVPTIPVLPWPWQPGGCAGCRRTGICNCTINPWAPRIWSSTVAALPAVETS